ncbi:hypothetical protein GCM10022267_11260 [Lentzea roselyniae]|uniref:AMP-dependent synthetase/ligase domain-containing protein n=1 Tax=Lentzea roselyniae TaxID=531940 RepID=A0ABP7A819_9PSEU
MWKRSPERSLFTFVDEHGRDEETITAAALGEAAAAIGGALRGWGFQPGDRALLVHPPGADFVRALLGCLAAGVAGSRCTRRTPCGWVTTWPVSGP